VSSLKAVTAAGHQPVVISSPQVRAVVRQLLEPHLPAVAVLAYNEIIPAVEVESMALVTAEEAEGGRRRRMKAAALDRKSECVCSALLDWGRMPGECELGCHGWLNEPANLSRANHGRLPGRGQKGPGSRCGHSPHAPFKIGGWLGLGAKPMVEVTASDGAAEVSQSPLWKIAALKAYGIPESAGERPTRTPVDLAAQFVAARNETSVSIAAPTTPMPEKIPVVRTAPITVIPPPAPAEPRRRSRGQAILQGR